MALYAYLFRNTMALSKNKQGGTNEFLDVSFNIDSFVFWFDLDSMTTQRDPPQKISMTRASATNQIEAWFSWFCKQKHAFQVELFRWRSFWDVIVSKSNQNTNESMTLDAFLKKRTLVILICKF